MRSGGRPRQEPQQVQTISSSSACAANHTQKTKESERSLCGCFCEQQLLFQTEDKHIGCLSKTGLVHHKKAYQHARLLENKTHKRAAKAIVY